MGVPSRAAAAFAELSGSITEGITDFVRTTATRVVRSGQFATLWTDANRLAHGAVDKALTGRGGGAIRIQDGEVTLDLAPVVERVKAALVADGLAIASRIPEVHATYTIMRTGDLDRYRTSFRLLQLAGDRLPLATLALAAGAVFLANDRRRALIGVAIGTAVAMLLVAIALVVVRAIYIDRLPASVPPPAAGAVFDAVVRFLRTGVRTVFVLALAVAIGAWITGPSRRALQLRTICRSGIGASRTAAAAVGVRTGAVGRFVHGRKRLIGVVLVLAAAAAFVLWNRPTPWVTIGLAAALLAALAIREFLDAQEAPAKPGSERGDRVGAV